MPDNLLKLLQLTDLSLPIGGFSHSAGLETYVQSGVVVDKNTAMAFVSGQLSLNLFHTDGAFVSLAFDLSEKHEWNQLSMLDEQCNAVKLPKEIRIASQKLGLRLLKIFEQLVPTLSENEYLKSRSNHAFAHYPVVFGLCASLMKIEKLNALKGFYYNAAAGMVTNCVKLIPLGQQDGQAILFSLHDMIDDLASRSLEPNPELIGLCCTGFDIRSMQHETLYSRLYMS